VELIHFRQINYTLGYLTGDELLKQVAARLRLLVGENSTIARISNVQFGVLLPEAGAGEAIELAARLQKALEEPLPAGEINYELGAHAGIASFPEHGDDPDVLIRRADIALYQARTAGRDYFIYNAAQDPYKPQRLTLLGDFRKAVKEDQLQLYFQPKADLRTGAITSGEALVRWQHPAYGLLLPDQFIPVIEPTELIQLLTQRMLEASIQQCYQWRQKNLFLPLAVNLSTRNLLNPDLPGIIDGLMQTWGADKTWVGLEITESSIMLDPAASLRVLDQLHRMGLKLFIDDFGIGYSSLSYLMKLPIDTIKIDHSFTMHMIEDPDAATIVKSTIELAHNMGMKVVAEGAASREIWEALRRLGCDEAQGYYISPPLPAKDFRAWIERSSWSHSRPS
jgi:diguanylate cyclase (GGDEF)-like protein